MGGEVFNSKTKFSRLIVDLGWVASVIIIISNVSNHQLWMSVMLCTHHVLFNVFLLTSQSPLFVLWQKSKLLFEKCWCRLNQMWTDLYDQFVENIGCYLAESTTRLRSSSSSFHFSIWLSSTCENTLDKETDIDSIRVSSSSWSPYDTTDPQRVRRQSILQSMHPSMHSFVDWLIRTNKWTLTLTCDYRCSFTQRT